MNEEQPTRFVDPSAYDTRRRRFAGEGKSARVVRWPGESIDSLIKRWLKGCQRAEIPKEIRRHAFYVKPSQRRRLKSMAARRRRQQ